MEHAWSPAAKAHLDTLRLETDALGLLYGEIMRLLPDFRSYDNPIAYMQARDYAMEGAELQLYTSRVKSRLAQLTATQNAALRARTSRMEELGAQLTMYAGRVAWVVVILGIALGVIVTRSIVQPMKELKRALLHMGRGVLPDRKSEGHFGRDWRHGPCGQSIGGGIGTHTTLFTGGRRRRF